MTAPGKAWFYAGRGGFSLDAHLSTAVDAHPSAGPVHRVVLQFDADAARLGEEFVWNDHQQVSRDE